MKRIHFIGIGGYSMSGLALWLHQQGHRVTGSDMNPSTRTDRLIAAGIPVYFGHDPAHVGDVDEVIYSTDVGQDNVERAEAVQRGIPLRHRSEMLAQVLENKRTIAVSGTHGKTTTTTMIGTILAHAGLDPLVLVGGEVDQFGGNTIRVGQSEWAVAEADESDGTFLRYHPEIAVATNVEAEHLEHYQEDFSVLVDAFRHYLSLVSPLGTAVVCVDNPILQEMADTLTVPVITYGFHPHAQVRGVVNTKTPSGTTFQAFYGDDPIGEISLGVPGRHNVQNALAALAVAWHLKIDPRLSTEALSTFRNANRRFQVLTPGPVLVVDDYAHHPTEIRATLEACRQVTPGRVIVLFQPQRYVRTHRLWDQFLEAFGDADMVVLTEIYSPPGEKPIPGVTGRGLAEAIAARHPGRVHFVPDMFDAVDLVMPMLEPGDTFLTMGAGPVYKVGEKVSALMA